MTIAATKEVPFIDGIMYAACAVCTSKYSGMCLVAQKTVEDTLAEEHLKTL